MTKRGIDRASCRLSGCRSSTKRLREPGGIMKKLLVMMLMALSLAAIAPAITASPAFAAQARCRVGELQAPWWWGNKNALDRTGSAHVLAIRLPAVAGKDAFL